MIELIETDDHVFGFRATGKLSGEEFDRIVAYIDDKFTRHERLRMYAEIERLGGMSLGTFWKNLQFSLSNYGRIDKAAIVTDLGWVRTFAGLENKLFAKIDVRGFPLAEREAAMAWLIADGPSDS